MLQYGQHWCDHWLSTAITSSANRINPGATDISQSIDFSPQAETKSNREKIEHET
jgi:hypothetical protein